MITGFWKTEQDVWESFGVEPRQIKIICAKNSGYYSGKFYAFVWYRDLVTKKYFETYAVYKENLKNSWHPDQISLEQMRNIVEGDATYLNGIFASEEILKIKEKLKKEK